MAGVASGQISALLAFDASLGRLGLEYVDLYLLHWPVAGKRLDSWRALERLYNEKRARAVGVSNFLVPHLEELLAGAHVVPAVNQIELTPFLQRRATVDLCMSRETSPSKRTARSPTGSVFPIRFWSRWRRR